MQITIHLDSANDDVLDLLGKLAGTTTTSTTVINEAPKAAPAAKKAAPKPAPAPEPETAVAETAPEPETAVAETAPEGTDTGTLEEAVARASALVTAGKSDQVKKALSGTGATRVSQLAGDDIAIFLAAL